MIIDVMVCVMKKFLHISIRVEIVPKFDFQINVHRHIEARKNQPFGSLFSVYFQGLIQITTSNTLHCFLLTPISCHVIWRGGGARADVFL